MTRKNNQNNSFVTEETLRRVLLENNKVLRAEVSKDTQKIVSEAVDDLALSVKVGFDRVDERFEKVDGRLEKIEGRLEKVEEKLEKVEVRLELVEVRLEKVEERLEKVEVRLDGAENQIRGVNSRLDYFAETYQKRRTAAA